MRTSVIAVALTLAVAAPLTAEAKSRTVEFNRIVGDTATAEWDYSDGDVVTYVNVVVTRNNVSDNQSGKSKDAFVSLAISQSSISTGNVIITGSGYTSDFDFSVDKDLKMATLHAKNVIFQDDNSFTFFNVDIDLNWTATGATTSSASHDHVHSPGLLMLSMFKGEFRDASAAGSIFGKNMQFTPTPSTQGQLQHNKFGTVTITTGKP